MSNDAASIEKIQHTAQPAVPSIIDLFTQHAHVLWIDHDDEGRQIRDPRLGEAILNAAARRVGELCDQFSGCGHRVAAVAMAGAFGLPTDPITFGEVDAAMAAANLSDDERKELAVAAEWKPHFALAKLADLEQRCRLHPKEILSFAEVARWRALLERIGILPGAMRPARMGTRLLQHRGDLVVDYDENGHAQVGYTADNTAFWFQQMALLKASEKASDAVKARWKRRLAGKGQ
jgi:hypothetical protein